MIVVLGSGFGLYGHVAALAPTAQAVAAPARYLERAAARPELVDVISEVDWVADEWSAIAKAEITCLARRPADNQALVHHMLTAGVGGTLVLEKPIAPTWQEAQRLEQAMTTAGRRWRTPYLLLYCDWFQFLVHGISQGEQVTVHWHHCQSPQVRSWKGQEAEGGGAINFYFIHWLAVLEALLPSSRARYSHKVAGNTEYARLIAAEGGAELDVAFELGDKIGFEIKVSGRLVYNAQTPFGPVPRAGLRDPRIPMLQRFYQDVCSNGNDLYDNDFQLNVTRRWRDICDD